MVEMERRCCDHRRCGVDIGIVVYHAIDQCERHALLASVDGCATDGGVVFEDRVAHLDRSIVIDEHPRAACDCRRAGRISACDIESVEHHIGLRLDHHDMIQSVGERRAALVALEDRAAGQRVACGAVGAPSAHDAEWQAAGRLLDVEGSGLRVKVAECIYREEVALLDINLELLVAHFAFRQRSEICYGFVERAVGVVPR